MNWLAQSKAHVWHPFTQMKTAPDPLPVKSAKDEFLYLEDGRTLIDGISSWWVTLHGHSYEPLVRALQNQATLLDQVIFAGFTHEPAARLAARLSALWNHQLPRVFYSDNGSTAVEVALKLSVQSRINRGESDRTGIVALENAYHGDTLGAMSAGDRGPFTVAYGSMLFDVYRIPSPAGLTGPVSDETGKASLDALSVLLDRHGKTISAVIVEPAVQGAGGMRMWPAGILKTFREITARHGVHLIADEVMTGFGRTGSLFACQAESVVPDLLCLSKGITGGMMPLSVTMASQDIYDAFLSEDRYKTFFHGHSYTANPMACAIANASLDVFETEPVMDRVSAIGKAHQNRFADFRMLKNVTDVRQRGTILAVELDTSDAGYFSGSGPKLYQHFLEAGALIRPLGSVVYLLPPFCISPASLDRLHTVMLDHLSDLNRQP
ncbi:MAG: adenosylmethionine--8-amino-7-oxononanoate transaminase [Bacteroidetes bacterium]|nr:adenosylmethionine--8-amino-7-oxononanoate transaminase [Bacteroidota bacterium]